MNKLLQRIITAVVLLALILTVMFALPTAAVVAILGTFMLAAAWEWAGFLSIRSGVIRALYVAAFAVALLGILWSIPGSLPLSWLLAASLLWWTVALVLVFRFPVPIAPPVTAVCGFLILLPAWAGLVGLLRIPVIGEYVVLYLLAIIWAADVGAYFAGRHLGRVKLAPHVSPAKTWEGVAGGALLAVSVAAAGAGVVGVPLVVAVPLALSLTLISVLGDLTVSLFKRNAGVKDSGNLFPGHGGVLDRFDSVAAAVPLFASVAIWARLFALEA